MSEPRYQITYTATLEEMVETALASETRLKAPQRRRRNDQLSMAGLAASLAALVLILTTDRAGWEALGVVLPLSLLFVGAPVYWLWGRYYDWHLKRAVAEVVAETWDGDGTPCENEFWDEQLCARQHGLEARLAWSELSEIEDTPDAVLLWFGHALARFPSRIFADDSERERLIRTARELGDKAREAGRPAS